MKKMIRSDLYLIINESNISREDRIKLYRALEKHEDNLYKKP